MRKLFFILAFTALTLSAFAQNYYLVPQKGKVLEYTIGVKSPMGSQTIYSKQYIKEQSSELVKVGIDVYTNINDQKPIQSSEIVYNIANGNYTIPIAEMMKSIVGQLGEFKIISSSGNVVFPLEPKIGDELASSQISLKVNIQGMDLTMDIDLKNRKIEGKEKITVPAGEFECYKMTQEAHITAMGQTQVSKSFDYYAPGIGLVKSTVDVMNGMSITTSELKSISSK